MSWHDPVIGEQLSCGGQIYVVCNKHTVPEAFWKAHHNTWQVPSSGPHSKDKCYGGIATKETLLEGRLCVIPLEDYHQLTNQWGEMCP